MRVRVRARACACVRAYACDVPFSCMVCYGSHIQTQVLKWARENGMTFGVEVFSKAALGGHMHILKWAHANDCHWFDLQICSNAALGGHLEVLKWALANGCPSSSSTCAQAAAGGHLETLQWAHTNGE